MNEEQYIYKYIDRNKENAYVGITNNLKRRHNQHMKDEWYDSKMILYYFTVQDRPLAEYIEKLLINKYQWKYNKKDVGSCDGESPFVDISGFEWIEYKDEQEQSLEEIKLKAKTIKQLQKQSNNLEEEILHLKNKIEQEKQTLEKTNDTLTSLKQVNNLNVLYLPTFEFKYDEVLEYYSIFRNAPDDCFVTKLISYSGNAPINWKIYIEKDQIKIYDYSQEIDCYWKSLDTNELDPRGALFDIILSTGHLFYPQNNGMYIKLYSYLSSIKFNGIGKYSPIQKRLLNKFGVKVEDEPDDRLLISA